jgi:hypothetical protein
MRKFLKPTPEPHSTGHRSRIQTRIVVFSVLASLLGRIVAGSENGVNPHGLIQSPGWLALGPFRSAAACSGDDGDLLTLPIAPSSLHDQAPAAGDAVAYDPVVADTLGYLGPGNPPFWRALSASGSDDDVDLLADALAVTASGDGACTFLTTYLEYLGPKPTDIKLCIGTDDGVQVWWDDQLVHNFNVCRPYGQCQDRIPVTVPPGAHRILMGIWNHRGQFRASLGIQGDGMLLTDASKDWRFAGAVRPVGYSLSRSPPLVVRSVIKTSVDASCPPLLLPALDVSVTQEIPQGLNPDATVQVVETLLGEISAANIASDGSAQVLELPIEPRKPLGLFADSAVVLVRPICPQGNGEVSFDPVSSVYSFSSIGEDVWANGDSFTFAYSQVRGDFSLTAQFNEMFGEEPQKAAFGPMARFDLSTRSSYVSTWDSRKDGESVTFNVRSTYGGHDDTFFGFFPPGTHATNWRIERVGNIFIGSISFDGVQFEFLGLYEWRDAPRELLVGLGVTSRTTDCALGLTTIKFDGVQLDLGPDAELVPLDPPRSPGVQIIWNVTREELSKGLRYTVRAPPGTLWFQGTAGDQALFGPASLTIPERSLDLGPFPLSRLEHGHAIGGKCISASIRETASALTIEGSGDGLAPHGDQLVFAYREIAGDFAARVKIDERALSGAFGIMARQDCSGTARFASVLAHGGEREPLVRFASRATHGGADLSETGAADATARSSTLRLDRTGSVLIGYELALDDSWAEVGRHDLGADAPHSMQVGLWAASGLGCDAAPVKFSDWQLTAIPVEPRFRRGDTDGDGAILITDVIWILRAIFLGDAPLGCEDAADFDDSGALDISDAIASLSYQFLGGAAPSAPGLGACGPDPTEDALGQCDGAAMNCR